MLGGVHPVWIVGNGIAVAGSFFCMGYLYRARPWPQAARLPVTSIALILATSLITGLQFVFPELLAAFRRDLDGLRAGELWRLVTPLFVQPKGLLQCLFNAIFLIAFLPFGERLYGRLVVALFFIPGIAGQLVNYVWDPSGGGTSTAAFGVMGGLLVYILRNRSQLPMPASFIAVAALIAAVALSVFRDGHGPAMLIGAATAFFLPARNSTTAAQATA